MTAHPTDLLPGYVLGDLDAQEAETVEVHLLGCPACRAEVARLRDALFSLADDLPVASPPSGTWERIQARRQPVRVRRPVPPWPWLFAAAVVALLALGGYTARLTLPQQASVQRWEAQGATRLALTSRAGPPGRTGAGGLGPPGSDWAGVPGVGPPGERTPGRCSRQPGPHRRHGHAGGVDGLRLGGHQRRADGG